MSALRRTRILAAAGLLAGLSACAVRGAGRDTLLSDAPLAAHDRRCLVAGDPEQLPAAADLVDASAFTADAARLWAAAGKPAGYVLLSLRYDPNGLNVRRAVLEHNVAPEVADAVQRLAFAHRLEVRPARAEWGVRLRVDLGPAPTLRVGRREVCRPAPREWEHRAAGNGFDVRSAQFASIGSTDPRQVWVRVRLDARGMVTDARLERTLYRGMWEPRILAYVRSLQFQPALEDGYPVPGELSIPMALPSLR